MADEAGGVQRTPYSHLRQLADTLNSPSKRAANSRVQTTPGTAPRTGKPRRPVPGKITKPSTPHALRALEQRRAAATLTPGRSRRRSGRQDRETPRDILRNLSRVLPNTKRTSRTPQQLERALEGTKSQGAAKDDEDEDGDELVPPRLSMPFDENDDDDSFIARAPRLSLPIDDEETMRSIEGSRRAFSEQAYGRYSRGSVRMSDRFTDLENIADEDEEGIDDTDDIYDNGGDTEDLRRAIFDNRNDLPDDTTFGLDIPLHVEASDPPEVFDPPEAPQFDEGDNADEPTLASMASTTRQLARDQALETPEPRIVSSRKREKSKHALPAGLVKKLALSITRSSGNSKTKVNKDALGAILQATDWFFEQVSEDLGAYAEHAGRKNIEEADVITLMKRQRLLNDSTTPFSLAQKFLPRELLQDIRLPPPKLSRSKRQRRVRRMEAVTEEDEEHDGD